MLFRSSTSSRRESPCVSPDWPPEALPKPRRPRIATGLVISCLPPRAVRAFRRAGFLRAATFFFLGCGFFLALTFFFFADFLLAIAGSLPKRAREPQPSTRPSVRRENFAKKRSRGGNEIIKRRAAGPHEAQKRPYSAALRCAAKGDIVEW